MMKPLSFLLLLSSVIPCVVGNQGLAIMQDVPTDLADQKDTPVDEAKLHEVLAYPSNKISPRFEDALEDTSDTGDVERSSLERRQRGVYYPNGRCPVNNFYIDGPDDHICDSTFGGTFPHNHYATFASYGSVCDGSVRRLTCRSCKTNIANYGDNHPRITNVRCPVGSLCYQQPERYGKWGIRNPDTMCESSSLFKETRVRLGEIAKEFCTPKITFPGAAGGHKFKFHGLSYSPDSGLNTLLRWFYLKVNDGYVASAQTISEWDVDYVIKSSDVIQMCGVGLLAEALLQVDGKSV